MFEAPPLPKLQEAIASPTNPIGMRMRAAYYLRQAYENYQRNKDDDQESHECVNNDTSSSGRSSTAAAAAAADTNELVAVDQLVIETLQKGLEDQRHGSLLRHEFAYVMGQIRDERVSQYIINT